MNCPNCQTPNSDTAKFCQRCGHPFVASQALAPAFEQPLAPQPPAPVAPTVSHPQQPLYTPSAYGATDTSLLNFWGPFAGLGSRRRHLGWLMDNRGDHAVTLSQNIETKFKERDIPKTRISKRILTARGVGVEQRTYFILQRGLVTMGLYVASFGRDLFISLVSYLKPPLSNFRILFVIAMLVFQAFMTFVYPVAMNAALNDAMAGVNLFGGGGLDFGAVFLLACLVGPLGFVNTLLLFLLLGFSAYKWLTEKDFLAAVRVPPNEFNEDDLMAMEKAIEQTVRLCLDDLGLSFDDFKRVDMTEKVWRI